MSKRSGAIGEAFCPEIGANVNIFEASAHYFSLPESQRERLHFECPDEECRAALHPQMIGAMYDREIYTVTPYFRRNSKFPHLESCYLGRYENILKEMLSKKRVYTSISDRNIFLDIEDAEDCPDVLITSNEVVPKIDSHRIKNPAKLHKVKDNDIERKICTQHSKTRSLKKVVEAFERLTIEQRNIPTLTINGHTLPYGKAFKHIRFMEDWHTWRHIYYGSGKVFRYKKYENGFRVFFDERVLSFTPVARNLECSVFFPLNGEEIPSIPVYADLQRAVDSGARCCIYMLASRDLVNGPLGSSPEPKDWIKLSATPEETVIMFNERVCKSNRMP